CGLPGSGPQFQPAADHTAAIEAAQPLDSLAADTWWLQKPFGAACLQPMPPKSRPPQDTPDETPHYHGHRERLRERFYSAGPAALSDYELLEMALYAAIPR